jgi:hypothetical protein
MTFRRSDLQEAFTVSGTYPFRVFGYGTTDSLEEVLRPGYFEAARALLGPGSALVRLVQDLGRADDSAPAPLDAPATAAEAPPAKRPRGRPPGSRSKKSGQCRGFPAQPRKCCEDSQASSVHRHETAGAPPR